MAFLKAAWRFVMGVKDVLVLCFLLLFFGGLYAALTMAGGERPMAHHGALLLNLDGIITEQPHDEDPLSFVSGSQPGMREFRLRDIVTVLEAARTDNRVKAVVLDLDGFMGGGHVALARIGKALDGVRETGKPVLAFATTYEDDGYLLAAHASEIWLNPIGGVAIMGPGGSQLYYKGLIDKLGVTANIYRVGTYKSAVEPFLRADQSPAARQANQALADVIWQNWRDTVQRARPKAQLTAYTTDPLGAARSTGGDMALAAQKTALIDRIGDETTFGQRVAQIAGEDDASDSPGYAALHFDKYAKSETHQNDGNIGVLTVAGEIIDGEAGPGIAGGDSIAMLLHEALAERDLRALVVRVDSPGGSVVASEKIRGAILEARKAGLPVVTSMGNVAASGGYWISTASDKILAQPSTITGSIGVFGILPSFETALAKAGITSDGIRTTPLSGEPDMAGGVSPEFNSIAQLGVEDMYRRFIGLVAKARRLSPQRVDSIAQGRVWDGGTARKLGLVDDFGDMEDAIALAGKLAKLDPAKARPYYIEGQADPFTAFIRTISGGNAKASMPVDLFSRQAWRAQQWAMQAIADARLLTEGAAIQASCLECRSYAPPAPAKGNHADIGWLGWIRMLIS